MKTCKKCQLEIRDDSITCPLCKGVLEEEKTSAQANRYPQAVMSQSGYHMINRVLLFISILIVTGSIIANYATYSGILWSLGSIAAVVYGWVVIHFAIRNSMEWSSKIIIQAVAGSLLAVTIDWINGFKGWSLNYIIPQFSILGNSGIFILLLISRLDWKKYVLRQMGMALLGMVPLVLWLLDLVTKPVMTFIATGVAGVVLLFTIIFGDRSLKSEIRRRFHI